MVIPKNISEVSTGWLGEALNAEVSAIDVVQIGQGVGLMGDIYKVGVTCADGSVDQGVPKSVVVKLPSSFEENRTQGVALGMFEAEVKFYSELAGECPVGLPEVYYTDIKVGEADFVIVMEDLSDMTLVSQFDGMNAEQAMAAVKVLASIHAIWWQQTDRDALSWIPTMTGPRIEFVDAILPPMLPKFTEGFTQYLPEGGIEIFSKFAGNYLTLMKVMAERSPWTLAHQDYRVENLLFGSDRVVVIDWQGIGLGPGAYDLAYILGGSMDTELRRANETALLEAYHGQLVADGVSDYSYDQLKEDYAHAHLLGGLATSMITGGGMDLSNERGLQLISTMASRHAAAALDHDGLARLADIL